MDIVQQTINYDVTIEMITESWTKSGTTSSCSTLGEAKM